MEMLATFLDFSKAFDRICHTGLLFKLKKIGIRGLVITWLPSYLDNRIQRLILPGASTSMGVCKCWSTPGSVLGNRLFLFESLKCNPNLRADVTSPFNKVERGK